MPAWVETWSGRMVDLMDPQPETICIDDIAHALARLARFNGHTRTAGIYSVADHCLWCSGVALDRWPDAPGVALQALLHDAHEAYTGDIVAPLKFIPQVADVLRPIEESLQAAIHTALGVRPPTMTEATAVRHIDAWALHAEAVSMMATSGRDWGLTCHCPEEYLGYLQPSPATADGIARQFLEGYHQLKEKCHE